MVASPAFWDKELPPDSVEYKNLTPFLKKLQIDASSLFRSILFKVPVVKDYVNTSAINKVCGFGGYRPYTLSCKADYTSYDSLTDYSYSGRHLPPASEEYIQSLPDLKSMRELFERVDGIQTMCPRSTDLFPTFAQHLIDSFIQTKIAGGGSTKGSLEATKFDFNKTTTPHDIGLSPLYGENPEQTLQLRLCSNEEGMKGKFKTQIIKGEEWAPFLFDADGEVKEEFNKLDYPQALDHILSIPQIPGDPKVKKSTIFAFGGKRTNLTPNVAIWNTLLLREHNRIAGEIEKSEPAWDDERVFQTARNVLLVIYLKQIVEEYIAHITGYGIDPFVNPNKDLWFAKWYKRNWISAEFSVLYRWHALVPNVTSWGGEAKTTTELLFNNTVLLDDEGMKASLRDSFVNISRHRATSMQVFNTETSFLADRDLSALLMGRSCRLKPYADYCEYMEEPRPKTFADISADVKVQEALKKFYGTPDRVEFMAGLMAADHPPEGLFSTLLTKFVAMDAFNQALTHPLLSENVWQAGEKTFGKYGMNLLKKNKFRIKDLIERNTKGGEVIDFIGMTQPNYQKKYDGMMRRFILLSTAGIAVIVAGVIGIVKK